MADGRLNPENSLSNNSEGIVLKPNLIRKSTASSARYKHIHFRAVPGAVRCDFSAVSEHSARPGRSTEHGGGLGPPVRVSPDGPSFYYLMAVCTNTREFFPLDDLHTTVSDSFFAGLCSKRYDGSSRPAFLAGRPSRGIVDVICVKKR